MAGRAVPFSSFKAGITRLRTKGGASPESLFDLVNGHVNASNAIEARPGTRFIHELPAGTKGLTTFDGKLQVFSHHLVAMTNAMFQLNVVQHPTTPSAELTAIHFAEPIMRGIYVSAEFNNGDVFHYWLQQPDAWEANTAYTPGQLVRPSVPTGILYRASRLDAPNLLWAPNVARAVGDKVEPTTANGFYYQVSDVDGATPKSGETEPDWPTEEGASVRESTDIPPADAPETAPETVTTTPVTGDRYRLAEDQWLDEKTQVKDVVAGFVAHAFSPERGLHTAVCRAVGERRLEPCVRLVMRSGCSVVCSATTPVNYMTAAYDMEPGQWAFAPSLAGFDVLDDSGGSMVEAVLDAGMRWVVPLDFGGVSFAGGERPTARVYTHNMAKPLDIEDDV